MMRALFAACLFLAGCDFSGDPAPARKSVFRPVASSTNAEVSAFLSKGGGGKAKLVFVDRTGPENRLNYIDFSESSGSPVIHQIPAAVRPSVPVISPDGEWVVYASGAGSEAGSPLSARSSVWLVRLRPDAKPTLIAADSACEPRFVQDKAGGLSIVYTTLAPDFGWEGYGKTMKVDVDVTGANPVAGVPEAIIGDGSYTGGLSWDGRYLVGGGGHVAMLDRQGTRSRPDTLSLNMIQSCNASISASRLFTNTMMYLNTSGAHPALNGGKTWGEWQAILISNGAKQLVKGFMFPASPAVPLETEPPSFTMARWHHCEWSNHPYFAAATLNADRYFKVAQGYENSHYQERIYLVNLKDSTYLEVLRPDKIAYSGRNGDVSGFHWPWLWVEVPSGFQEEADWLKAPN